MKTFLVYNNKGGSGKTSICNAVAVMLAQNKRVLIVDTDAQGNLSFSYGLKTMASGSEKSLAKCLANILNEGEFKTADFIQPTDIANLDILAGGRDMTSGRNMVQQAFAEGNNLYMAMLMDIERECDYDYVIFDSSPLLASDTTAILFAVDYALIPTNMDAYGLDGVEETVRRFNIVKRARSNSIDYGIIRNNYNKKDTDNEEIDSMLFDTYGDHIFESIVYTSTMPKKNQYNTLNPNSRQSYFVSIRKVVKELVKRIGN